MAKIITVTSGKGGAGKTSISLNLALELARSHSKVCLFDADLGLANINILTGIQPEHDLESVLLGTHTLNEIIIKNFQGIDIIPGSSGVEKMADLTKEEAGKLISSFIELDDYDYFIFDTSAGISAQVLSFCMASHEIVLVVTSEPTSLTDAYALLKILSQKQYTHTVNVLVNQVKNVKSAKNAYGQLRDTVNRFLKIRLYPLGIVVADRHVSMAVIAQTPFVKLFPEASASKCIGLIARKLASRNREKQSTNHSNSLELFWRSCLGYLSQRSLSQGSPAQDKDISANGSKTYVSKKKKANLLDLIERMETKISTLMEEIKAVRHLLETQSLETQAPKNQTRKKQPVVYPEIELDFEAWFAKTL
eukprot:TRINITY_DN47263_c0_g1_i1.p1 TRINITY_DN47263_c0_g1~~TRINITY_DN47263_c0_g1_i1.p1  ORF type:complete len:364 (-),score=23.12 TRINITY_DN47263_c0_g1_i1:113-1204(-)